MLETKRRHFADATLRAASLSKPLPTDGYDHYLSIGHLAGSLFVVPILPTGSNYIFVVLDISSVAKERIELYISFGLCSLPSFL